MADDTSSELGHLEAPSSPPTRGQRGGVDPTSSPGRDLAPFEDESELGNYLRTRANKVTIFGSTKIASSSGTTSHTSAFSSSISNNNHHTFLL